ncbi:Hpt domain-containing protein [Natronohydrobacter thiooxidans]|uniref:Hpt domain-containing protein n=1 Tax=Natronohydrobacter thiooxidans TaxID=87172 RepID=UPI0008FF3862|nr:Hpt domain-containing protein [Natronohydrobacter thiooxidans]
MVEPRLDTALLDSLVEMGGEDLRAQLLADLQNCETALKALCFSDQQIVPGAMSGAAQVLHTLRGLAMTIGATALVRNCMQAEELGSAVGRETLVQSLVTVVQECASVCAYLEYRPDRDA